MRKISLAIFIVYFFSGIAGCLSIAKTKLQKKFPSEMLSNDYGILDENAVRIYAEESDPLPVSQENGNHGFWICIERKDINFVCRDFDPFEKDPMERFGEPEIHLNFDNKKHLYIWSRGIEIEGCYEQVRIWSKLSKKVPYVCIAGYRIKNERLKTGELQYSWTFDQLRTAKGCDSRIVGRCENLDSDEYEVAQKKKTRKKK